MEELIMKKFRSLAVLLIVLVLMTACSGGEAKESGKPAETTAKSAQAEPAAAPEKAPEAQPAPADAAAPDIYGKYYADYNRSTVYAEVGQNGSGEEFLYVLHTYVDGENAPDEVANYDIYTDDGINWYGRDTKCHVCLEGDGLFIEVPGDSWSLQRMPAGMEIPEPVTEVEYRPEGGSEFILPQSSSQYLTEYDIYPLDEATLRIAINEIYARHGRRFNAQDLQNYFDSKTWYNGTIAPEAFDENVFNDYEKQNIDLMNRIREGGGGTSGSYFEPGWVYGEYVADFGDGKLISIEFGYESGTGYDYIIRSGYHTEETYIQLEEQEDDYWIGINEDCGVFYNGVDQIVVDGIDYQKTKDMPHNVG